MRPIDKPPDATSSTGLATLPHNPNNKQGLSRRWGFWLLFREKSTPLAIRGFSHQDEPTSRVARLQKKLLETVKFVTQKSIVWLVGIALMPVMVADRAAGHARWGLYYLFLRPLFIQNRASFIEIRVLQQSQSQIYKSLNPPLTEPQQVSRNT